MIMGNAVMAKAVMILAAYWVGTRLDARFGTEPWIMVVLLCSAIGFGLYFILLVARKNNLID